MTRTPSTLALAVLVALTASCRDAIESTDPFIEITGYLDVDKLSVATDTVLGQARVVGLDGAVLVDGEVWIVNTETGEEAVTAVQVGDGFVAGPVGWTEGQSIGVGHSQAGDSTHDIEPAVLTPFPEVVFFTPVEWVDESFYFQLELGEPTEDPAVGMLVFETTNGHHAVVESQGAHLWTGAIDTAHGRELLFVMLRDLVISSEPHAEVVP